MNEFQSIIKTQIHLNEIKKEEISEENLSELKELKIEICEYTDNHINMNLEEIKNEELISIIHKYYIKEEEEIEMNNRIYNILNKEEIEEDLIKLLNNEDMKVVEIVLNLIIKMNKNEIIPDEMKNDLLRKLLYEYGRSKINRTLKCLCLFIDDKKKIIAIEELCGKEFLYRILNEEYYLTSKSKELLMKYIKEMKLSLKEEEKMLKIIKNEELINKLKTKEIASFLYSHSEYWFGLNEEISIIPSFDGSKCEFSITPSLSDGIEINKKNGIINGKVNKEINDIDYEISCKNIRNEKKFKMSLEFKEIKFIELNKTDYISIFNNGKFITDNYDNYARHCYLNLKMENGIYHIKYQFHQNQSTGNNWIGLGLSTNNIYSGDRIYNQSTTCNYFAYDGKSRDITKYCHIGTIVNKNPNFNDHGDGSIYEVIVDMNKREFWISHNNCSPVLLVIDLPSPLYPYAALARQYTSIELLSVSRQN